MNRRDFLKGMAATATAASVPLVLSAEPAGIFKGGPGRWNMANGSSVEFLPSQAAADYWAQELWRLANRPSLIGQLALAGAT